MPDSSTSPMTSCLRVGIVQNGKLLGERIFKTPADVTLGSAPGNTFQVAGAGIPASLKLFGYQGGAYRVHVTEAMRPKMALSGGTQLDFAALVAGGALSKEGEGYGARLTERSEGKLIVGDVSVLFQFVQAPAAAVAVASANDGMTPIPEESVIVPTHSDHCFAIVLVTTLLVNFGSVQAISQRDPIPPVELTLADIPDRFAKIIMPDKPPEKEKADEATSDAVDETKVAVKETKKVEAAPKASAPATPEAAAARTAAIQKGVQSKGLLKLLGALGDGSDGGSAIEDVLGGGSASGDVASALMGASGVGVATADSLAAGSKRMGGGSGEAAGIGDLGTSGGAGVAAKLTEKKIVNIRGRVIDEGPEVDSSTCDRDAIARFVKGRMKSIQNCYEKELKRNPSLKGKIVVRFLITETGGVSEFEIEEDTMSNSSVTSCIRSTIRMWRFPIKDNECPVAYPFVFTPST